VTPSSLVREAVAATWAFRAKGEREAEDRFRRLARTLAELHAHETVQRLALSASADEERHAALCVDLVRAYGGSMEMPPVESLPVDREGMSLEDATLTEVVSLCCIAETLSVAALGAILEVTVATDIHDVVHAILKDETSHAKLGWAHLASERKAGRGDFLSARLAPMMAASIPDDLFLPGTDSDNQEALAFGQLSRTRRVVIFRETFDRVIFPGFDALGIGTAPARAWLASR
jgi:hypothetical protein